MDVGLDVGMDTGSKVGLDFDSQWLATARLPRELDPAQKRMNWKGSMAFPHFDVSR